ncbi:aminoglycoside phosphotransferase family protein [Actinoplanes sp. TBRC 11911]|uniref:aminoglycoside phosphotransferase family protein n=1 Tax=Actinoplanes sp. TBRC 11911 TaxID=2729386 RepID=UPI001B7D64E1|nr:aminoglycoside phosphotransferase family protein [Actinoplanes sp. TBRC 11911]
MHDDEIEVAPGTVRALVDAQFPRWRGLPIERVGRHGTVNAIFRVGDRLTARFPLRPTARETLEAEAEAARELNGRTRFATPEPVVIGAPGFGYPMSWSVQTWLPGVVATELDPGGSEAYGRDLADFVVDVRALDPRGRTFRGHGRGGDLTDHDEWMATCLRHHDRDGLRRMWQRLRELPRGAGPDTMTHGDLIPGNVLVDGGRLAGVLDVGGLGVADPALDLVAAWHLLEDGPRQAFRERLGCDDLEWERGRAWAFEQAMGVVWYYRETNPPMSRMGQRTLDRLTR